MKKILLCLFTACASISVTGQPYNALLGDTTEWNIGHNVFSVIHPRSIYIADGDHSAYGDTIIGGLNYKFFKQEWWPVSGYIREDTSLQKVWFRENGAPGELLLYDFSLSQNDSVFLTFPNYISGDPFPTGWYFVDSIIPRNITIGQRKFYYLSNPASPINTWDNNNRFYLVWIEGVGSNLHPAYIYLEEWGSPMPGVFSLGCPAFLHLVLVCAHKDGIQQFFDTCFWNHFQMYAMDSCHYSFPGGIDELNSSSLLFYPNPATNKLRIKNSDLPAGQAGLRIKNIQIYNILGERVYKSEIQNSKSEIDISELLPGIYFVKLTGDKTTQTGKFVKE